MRTVIDIYRTDENGNKIYIAKDLHNANSYNARVDLMEEGFGLKRNDTHHKPFKNFECFKRDLVKRWGGNKIVSCEVLPEFANPQSLEAEESLILEKYGSKNNRRALWFDIGRGGAQINTLTNQIQSTYNFNTTLYDCIPFRLTTDPLPEAYKTYGLGLKITFEMASGKSTKPMFAYYHKRVTCEEVIDGPEDKSTFDPATASTNTTDSVFVDPANIASKTITVAIKTTGTIASNEVVEFYEFLNGTSAGAFVNEIGFVRSKVMRNTSDADLEYPITDWDDCELYTHLESNNFDMSGSKSDVTISYMFYFN